MNCMMFAMKHLNYFLITRQRQTVVQVNGEGAAQNDKTNNSKLYDFRIIGYKKRHFAKP